MKRHWRTGVLLILAVAVLGLTACDSSLEGGRAVIEGQVRPFVTTSESVRNTICQAEVVEHQVIVGDAVSIQVEGRVIPLSPVGMYGDQHTTLYMGEYSPASDDSCQPEDMTITRTGDETLLKLYYSCSPVDPEGVYGEFECELVESVRGGVEK